MISVECAHCGATLTVGTPKVPEAVRCRRCGMRTTVGERRDGRPDGLSSGRPMGTTPAAVTPAEASESPHGLEPRLPPAAPSEIRVPAEEVQREIRPRPGFYDPESALQGRAGRAALVTGAVIGMLVALGTSAWLLVIPKSTPTAFIGPASSQSGPMATDAGPTLPAAPRATGASEPANDPDPVQAPAAGEGAAPGSGRESGTFADRIDVQPLFNDEVYLSSELSLRTYLKRELAELDDERLEGLLREAVEAKALEVVNRCVQGVAAEMWRRETWPTFALRFSGLPPEGVSVAADMRCADPTARKLLVGGPATETYPTRLEPDAAGVAGLAVDLRIDSSNVYALTAPANVNLSVDIRYEDGSVDRVQHTCRILPVSFVEKLAPFRLGFAAMVDEDHPLVKDLLAKLTASESGRRWGVSPGGPDPLPQVFLVWRELRARGIRYSSIADTSTFEAQEVRPLQEALISANANCADGSALIASILQKIGAKPELVFVPGHVFVGLPLTLGGDRLALETTLLEDMEPCSPGFRAMLEREHPDCAAFAARLHPDELREWLAMLQAVEVGHQRIKHEWRVIREGGARPNGRVAKPMTEVLQQLDHALRTEDADEGMQGLAALMLDYMSTLSVDWARQLKVRPVGHDPKALPTDGVGPLRSR